MRKICIRQLFSATRPRLNSPPHPGNLIFDRVDRLSRQTGVQQNVAGWLQKLWVTHRAADRIGVQDGRQWATVRRLPSAPPASDTSAIRRIAPRNFCLNS